jgi:putative two-component system response regulator
MSPILPKQCVLVVDDSPENIDLLSEILRDDYRVRVATSGEKALKIVYSDEPPDLILLDIMMPGISGLEICRRLKANPDRRRIPIIFVTAMSSTEDERRGLEIGAVDYITKPISPPIVMARVRTHLALYDQSRELAHMVAQRTAELLTTRQQIIRRLGRAAEFKDNETGNHVRMSHYARLIALAHGLGESAGIIFNTAPMHDIGKIGIPDAILLKPGKLDAAEWEVMYQHPIMGAEIIGKHDNELLETARIIALTHHEKFDGSGYPQDSRARPSRSKGASSPSPTSSMHWSRCAPTSPPCRWKPHCSISTSRAAAISTPPCSSPSRKPCRKSCASRKSTPTKTAR